VCGRYAASASPDDLVEELEVVEVEQPEVPADPGYAPDWNVAPTKQPPVVWTRRPRGEPDAEPVRRLRPLSWGLVPSWAKDRAVGSRMINARAESLLDKPAYRRAALARRCLVPADGWYEWQPSPVARDGRGRPRKQPFFVRLAAGGPLALAGVYEFWRDPTKDDEDPAAWLASFAVVTTAAEQGLDRIHDRMPLVLPRDRWQAWLDPGLADADAVRSLVQPPPPGRFTAVPVSTLVNDVRRNGPDLVAPLPVEELEGVVDPVTGELLGDGGPVQEVLPGTGAG
jgi:putative SOS response-associated peptidase YedK